MVREGSSPPRHAAGALGRPRPPRPAPSPHGAALAPGRLLKLPLQPPNAFHLPGNSSPFFVYLLLYCVRFSGSADVCKRYLTKHFLMMYSSTLLRFPFKSSKKAIAAALCQCSTAAVTTAQPGQPPAEGACPAVASALPKPGFAQTAVLIGSRFALLLPCCPCLHFTGASLGLLPCPGQVAGPEFRPGSRQVTPARWAWELGAGDAAPSPRAMARRCFPAAGRRAAHVLGQS